jgi:hypothetical protein
MLRFAQHDKLGSWIPHFADASVSMTGAVSFRAPFPVIPSESEESSAWMLHFVQHDKSGVIPSESEESSAWMLHFVQHDKVRVWMFHCAYAPCSMTVHRQDTRA